MKFERIFGKTAQAMVLENLIQLRGETTYISGIAAATGLSHSSVCRVIEPLKEAGVVTDGIFGKNIRTVTLNMESPATTEILNFYDALQSIEG